MRIFAANHRPDCQFMPRHDKRHSWGVLGTIYGAGYIKAKCSKCGCVTEAPLRAIKDAPEGPITFKAILE